jgi:hypothetical protein
MNKLTTFVLAALAAATVVFGALSAAQSASAATPKGAKTQLIPLRFSFPRCSPRTVAADSR